MRPGDAEHALFRSSPQDSSAHAEARLMKWAGSFVERARAAIERTAVATAVHAHRRVGREVVFVEQAD